MVEDNHEEYLANNPMYAKSKEETVRILMRERRQEAIFHEWYVQNKIEKMEQELAKIDEEIAKRDEEIAKKEAEIAKKEAEIAKKEAEIAKKEAEIKKRNYDKNI